ncbi:MAG TPA: tetratricopeptide repeat protein [Gemmataceae bacterium]|nr:tetratricopeptide repeat protein [Gemmataceae bacterium]
MRWLSGLVILALCLEGCESPSQERLRDYSQDGIYLFQRGEYLAARESFEAALTLKPDDPGLLYNVAECCDRVGDAAKAERYYHQCLAQAPNQVACRHALDALLLRSGRKDEAAHQVEAWLAREPRLAAAYAEDGWLWHQTGDLPRARARLEQALELDPHEPHALVELALVYEAMQRPDRAVVLYERILERDPRQVEVANRLNRLRSQGARQPQPE